MKKSAFLKLIGSALVGASILAACAGEEDPEVVQAEIEAWLQDNGYPADEAECVANATSNRFEVSDFEKLSESDEGGLASTLEETRARCSR